MKYLSSIAFTALACGSIVSAAAIGSPALNNGPSRVRRETLCTGTVASYTSEGAGDDNSSFGFSVNGPDGSDSIGMTFDSNGVASGTMPASAYGGTYDTTCEGSYNSFGYAWYDCSCNQVPGAVQKQVISSGTVSTITDNCIVVYDC